MNSATVTSTENRRTVLVLGAIVGVVVLALVLYAALGGARQFAERQRQALQKTAALDLEDLAKKESEFHARHGGYTTDLLALGIKPKSAVYKFGFVTASSAALPDGESHAPERKDLDELKRARPELKIAYSAVTKLNGINFADLASFCPDCTATASAFKAVAAANLDEDPTLDVWTIDETGTLHHLIDDLGQ